MKKKFLSRKFTSGKQPYYHFFKIMRIALFLLLITGFAYAGDVSSQNAKVSLNMDQTVLREVLEEIEQQTDYLFVSNKNIDMGQKVSIHVNNKPVSEALNLVLKDTNLTYVVEGVNIILTQKSTAVKVMKHIVKGVIQDELGEPIIGASIVEKGVPGNGSVSDVNGEFSLEVGDNAQLEISYIGYIKQLISVEGRSTINVILQEDTKLLEEVVVVGYGTMKKRDITGAISSVKMDDNPITTVGSATQVLAGKAAGLQINTVSAQPGGSATIRIRGAASPTDGMNEPLVIVDGFPVSATSNLEGGYYKSGSANNILASINPNDIESIEVLKDASSSAIYGSRAGNGVIIITTKRGKTGAAKVTYSGTASVQNIAKNYEVLSARDFMIESNRYAADVGKALYFTDEEIANNKYDTNWLDLVTRSGFQTQHNISVSGGTEATQYLVSGNLFKQNGIIKNNNTDRFTTRLNLDQRLSKFVKMGLSLTLSRNNVDNVALGTGQYEAASILVSAAQFNPTLPVRDENGDYVLNSQAAFLPNPVSLLEITNKTIKDRLLASAYVEVEPVKDLKFKANFGFDRNYQKLKVYMPKTTLYGQRQGGAANLAQSDQNDYLIELTGNYAKSFGEHSLNALAGYSFQQFNKEGFSASNDRFLTDAFLYNNIGAGNSPKPGVGSYADMNELASFFGRVNYSFKDKYLLTATLRADGSANFSENNRWGYFPSVSAGWRFIDEEFMHFATPIFSNGKLRVSYGETGRSNISNYVNSFYEVGRNMIFGSTENKGVYFSQLGNPDLKWETTREWNFGLELGLFKNRINLTAEYYRRNVVDLLSEQTLQSYQLVKKIMANVGSTQSQGFELTVNTQNIDTKDLSWSSDFTFSLFRDKWKERSPYWKPSVYSIYDAPLRGTYGYLSDGIIQAGEEVPWQSGAKPGQVKLKDIDGYQYNDDGSIKYDEKGFPMKSGEPDGKLNDADKVFYGSNDPGYLVGFNNTVKWKNLDFNIYFYGEFNNPSSGSYQQLWLTGSAKAEDIYRGYNMPTSIKDIWTADNPSGTLPGYAQQQSSHGVGDYFRHDAWFVRCRNITLGYTFQMPQTKKLFSNVRVYVDVNNPFTITNYKGLDPETDDSAFAYPNIRSFNFGVDITF